MELLFISQMTKQKKKANIIHSWLQFLVIMTYLAWGQHLSSFLCINFHKRRFKDTIRSCWRTIFTLRFTWMQQRHLPSMTHHTQLILMEDMSAQYLLCSGTSNSFKLLYMSSGQNLDSFTLKQVGYRWWWAITPQRCCKQLSVSLRNCQVMSSFVPKPCVPEQQLDHI